MINALNDLETLFAEAKAANEFEFVMTLLNYKSMGAPEIQANLHEWFEAMNEYIDEYNQATGKTKTRKAALLYSTFFENSDFYNIIGNLCRALLGMRATSYLFWKTKKYERLLGIGEKQDFLIELLIDVGKIHIIDFFEQNHYPEIRNSYFHSAYSLDNDNYILHDGNITINNVSQGSFNINTFFYPLVNNIMLFFLAFRDLYLNHFSSYKQDKPIGNTPLGNNGIIIGTPRGLGGMRFSKTVQFFGEWHDSGFWRDERFGIFSGHNINFNFPSLEKIEIDEQLARYEKKADISTKDVAFFNLIDKVIERNEPNEIKRAFELLMKTGDTKYTAMQAEPNVFRKKTLPKGMLLFYNKALDILNGKGDTKDLIRRINELEAILKT